MVFTLDFPDLLTRYPNAFVRIDEMKCDGNAIQFNANNFFYGDIEGKGNYRVELFNIYGKGAADGKVLNSAFSNSQNLASEPALHFSNRLEITCTVFTDGNGKGVYTPNLVTIPNWDGAGTWGYNAGGTLEVKYENFQYSLVAPQFDIKYEGTCYKNNNIIK